MGKYQEVFGKSISDPRAFWKEAAEDIDWYVRCERILDDSNPPFYRWFPDGELNTCHNAIDRHVASGRAEQPAPHCAVGLATAVPRSSRSSSLPHR